MGLFRIILYRFGDKWRYLQTISHRRVFNAPLKGFPLEFCNGARDQKLEWYPYITGRQKVWPYVHSFRDNTDIGRTDGQLDRHTELVKQYGAVHPCGAVNLCRIFVETTGSYNGPAVEDTSYSIPRRRKWRLMHTTLLS